MRREVIHVCRLLVKKAKLLLPLFMIVSILLFISHDQYTTSQLLSFKQVQQTAGAGENSTSIEHRLQVHTQRTTTPKPVDKYAVYAIRGERLAAQTRERCSQVQQQSGDLTLTVRNSKNNDLLFCPIYKVGTTFWRRVFMIQREKRHSHLVNPYLLPFDKEYPASKYVWRRNKTSSEYKIMFTRDPYNRLFSFYVDKLLAPNPYFWKSVGVEALALTRNIPKSNIKQLCGHNVTFPEFIKYVIHTLETRQKVDPHWVEMEKNCHPCEMKYEFIGQMEHFNEDSSYVINKLGLTKMTSFLENHGKKASVDDAIRDTLSQPFNFRGNYRKCMGFKDALLRAWYKLQIRGLIGNSTLDSNLIYEKATKLRDILWRAQAARNASTAVERTELKNKKFKELWKQVNTSDLNKLKELYSTDFSLFGYDSMPETVFQSKSPT